MRFRWRPPVGGGSRGVVHAADRLLGVGRSHRSQDVVHGAAHGALSGHAAGAAARGRRTARLHDGRGAGHRVKSGCDSFPATRCGGSTSGCWCRPRRPWDDVVAQLAERIQDLRSQTPANPLLVRWTLVAADVEVVSTSLRELAERSREVVAQTVCRRSPNHAGRFRSRWKFPIGLRRLPTRKTRCWATTCGRSARCRTTRSRRSGTAWVIWPRAQRRAPQWVADLSDPGVRAQVLQEAAEMGAALLRGERIS